MLMLTNPTRVFSCALSFFLVTDFNTFKCPRARDRSIIRWVFHDNMSAAHTMRTTQLNLEM